MNEPGDAFEQEADRVAEQVMRMPDPDAQAIAGPPARHAAGPSRGLPMLRRKCACGGGASGCASCKAEDDMKLQRKAVAPGGATTAPPVVHDVLRSPGRPLDAATRSYMEPRFGRDFGDVRVHSDSMAAESARAVGAHAYTVGSTIAFDDGEYRPGAESGRRLLAHELAHVVQQSQTASPWLSRWVSCDSTSFTGMEFGAACPPREPGEVARSRSGLSVGPIDAPETGEIVFGFAVGSSNASGLASDPTWRTFSSSIAASSTDRWEILGFTDCEGAESLNADLRQHRASRVSAQLPPAAKAQIDRSVGAPMTDCVASNDTESNRKFNRSVVFRRTSSTVTFPAESITGIQCPPTATITVTDLADYIALMQCAETRMGLSAREMLTVFRQLYYGKPWSNSKTSLWDRVIQCSPAVGDPQTKLGTPLFESLQKSQEVAGVDVGHVFAGLEAMTCPTQDVSFSVVHGLAKAVAAMPNEAFATWGGDLGAAAAAHVACDQLGSAAASKDECGMKAPPQTLTFYFEHHAPPQDLEGDIDPFIMRASENGITCASSPGVTFTPSRAISDIFVDAYINSTSKLGAAHQNRYECMLQLLGATISGKRVTNRAAIKSRFTFQVASFADLFFTKIKGGGVTNTSDAGDRVRMRADSSNTLDMFIDYLESNL